MMQVGPIFVEISRITSHFVRADNTLMGQICFYRKLELFYRITWINRPMFSSFDIAVIALDLAATGIGCFSRVL